MNANRPLLTHAEDCAYLQGYNDAASRYNADRFDALLAQRDELAQAAIAYDDAIQSCANSPDRMSSFCSATGDDLDTLYHRWITLARAVVAKVPK